MRDVPTREEGKERKRERKCTTQLYRLKLSTSTNSIAIVAIEVATDMVCPFLVTSRQTSIVVEAKEEFRKTGRSFRFEGVSAGNGESERE